MLFEIDHDVILQSQSQELYCTFYSYIFPQERVMNMCYGTKKRLESNLWSHLGTLRLVCMKHWCHRPAVHFFFHAIYIFKYAQEMKMNNSRRL